MSLYVNTRIVLGFFPCFPAEGWRGATPNLSESTTAEWLRGRGSWQDWADFYVNIGNSIALLSKCCHIEEFALNSTPFPQSLFSDHSIDYIASQNSQRIHSQLPELRGMKDHLRNDSGRTRTTRVKPLEMVVLCYYLMCPGTILRGWESSCQLLRVFFNPISPPPYLNAIPYLV